MTQPNGGMYPREIPGQDALNAVGGALDAALPGDHRPLGDAVAGALDDNPQDNNLPSDQQSGIFEGIADAIKDGFAPLAAMGNLGDSIMRLFLPTVLVRAVCGIAGVFFLLFGIALLAREVREKNGPV